METKVNAVVLRAADYGEYDKILTLLTAENGKISAGIKGVKRAGAKLRFAAQPFCFAEYILSARGDRFTVINASECESFYDLRTDILKFYAASAALEAADGLTYDGADGGGIFSATVRTLSEMCGGEECDALITYLLFALRKSGYGIAAERCAECGRELFGDEKLRFDFDSGSFTCYDCGDGAGVSAATYNLLRKIDGKSYDEKRLTDARDGRKRALRLLREYLSYKTGLAFKSLSEYIRLL